MATHSSVFAWRIPGTREPGGLPSMGSHRVRHDWRDLAAAAAALCLEVKWGDNIQPWLWRGIKLVNSNQKEVGVPLLIPDKIDFRTRSNIRDKKRYYTMIRRWLIQAYVRILNEHGLNHKCPNSMRETLLKQKSEVAQSFPALCDPIGCNLPGSSIHGILQASILEWGCHLLL